MQKNKTQKKPKGQKPKRIPFAYVAKTGTKGRSISQRGRDARIVVHNEEYVCDVIGSNVFTANSLAINAGVSGTFPWLSNIANNYEFYQFKSLRFSYRPVVGTTSAGAVFLAYDMDALDDKPTDKARMMSYQGSRCSPVYNAFSLDFTPSNMAKFGVQKFTRPSLVPATGDAKTYDIGNVHYATETTTVGVVGMIFVEYTVELSTPHSPSQYPWEYSAIAVSVTCTKADPFKDAALTQADPVDPLLKEDTTHSVFIKKAGEYLVHLVENGTGLTSIDLSSMLSTAFGVVTLVGYASVANAAGTTYNGIAKIKMNAPGPLTFTPAAGWTTLTSFALRLMPFGNSL